MTAFRNSLIAIACLFLLAACAGSPTIAAEDCVDCITAEGYVRHSTVEGGFWYLEADDGAKYDPYGIPEALAVDGLRVRFTVKPRPERMGFHMVGMIVELVEIEALEDAGSDNGSRPPETPPTDR